jgi:RNA ligase
MIEELNKLKEEGKVRVQSHPTLPLLIWNYTEQVAYSKEWTPLLLSCRGLITDNEGNFVAKGFDKFFNYEEIEHKNEIPFESDHFYVQTKMDGSLGILFYYRGEWVVATRGSFTSDQAIRAKKILDEKYNLDLFNWKHTYLFEIIYPENRIVVRYDYEDLIFISAFIKDMELSLESANILFRQSGIESKNIVSSKKLSKFSDRDYKNLKENQYENEEGYVIRFHPSNYRFKIKFEEYVRLHKVMTNLSTTIIWETLMNGEKIEEILDGVPDEIYDKIKALSKRYKKGYNLVEDFYRDIYGKIKNSTSDRKEFAEKAKEFSYPSLLFKMDDGKDYNDLIWEIIKPEYEPI